MGACFSAFAGLSAASTSTEEKAPGPVPGKTPKRRNIQLKSHLEQKEWEQKVLEKLQMSDFFWEEVNILFMSEDDFDAHAQLKMQTQLGGHVQIGAGGKDHNSFQDKTSRVVRSFEDAGLTKWKWEETLSREHRRDMAAEASAGVGFQAAEVDGEEDTTEKIMCVLEVTFHEGGDGFQKGLAENRMAALIVDWFSKVSDDAASAQQQLQRFLDLFVKKNQDDKQKLNAAREKASWVSDGMEADGTDSDTDSMDAHGSAPTEKLALNDFLQQLRTRSANSF